jgi:TRAP-type C4-dicarboxylate transport system permease small subunit
MVRQIKNFKIKFNTVYDQILDYTSIVAGILVAYMMLSVTYEVIVRYLGRPTMWVQEFAEISLLYITFLALASVARKGAHVKMDAIFRQLKPRVQSFLSIVYSVICVIISFVFLWYGSQVTWSYFERGLSEKTMMELPIGPILIIIPIGGLLMLIQFLRQTVRDVNGWKSLTRQEKHTLQ